MEKGLNKVATQVAQGVTTKTKVLVGVVMGLAAVGMFGFVGMAFENIKYLDYFKESNIQVQGEKEEKEYFVRQDVDSYSSFDSLGQYITDGIFNDREKKELGIKDIQGVLEKKGALWQGIENRIFKLNKEKKEDLLGLKITEEELREAKERERNQVASREGELPDFFDWRNLHGGLDYITSVKNQENCGSCWAFAALGAFEAGINAYYNNPDLNIDLSEQDLVSCYLGDGCNGAYSNEIEELFSNYFQNTGIANESCFSYTATDNTCSNKCDNWQEEAWKTMSFSNSEMTIDAIKTTLIENGPLEVGMEVYSDFLAYDNGIYRHIASNLLGYHAVLIVGYGVYDGMDYWIVKNSWGEDWGDNGYFKILAGDSLIDSWFAYGINIPEPLTGDSPERLCVDQDEDGYCYWGVGDMPSTCSSTCILDISDCNDANGGMFEDCGENTELTGLLNITSEPSDAEVYIKDLDSNDWIYRGNTPLEFELNVGERDLKIIKFGYIDLIATVSIEENLNENLFYNLEFNTEFLEGWPVELPIYDGDLENFQRSFSVADVNGDNMKEIILIDRAHEYSIGDFPDSIYIYESNGEPLLGWPKALPEYANSWSPPIVVDLDSDGTGEIIVSGRPAIASDHFGEGYVQIYNHDGSVFPGWPQFIDGPAGLEAPNSVDDIDKDGFLDIVVASGGAGCSACPDHGELYVFNSDGTVKEGWPYILPAPKFFRSPPVLVNLDDDDELEIIITVFHGENPNQEIHYTYVFNHDGSLVNGFPSPIPEDRWGWTLISGDINNDGVNEIITQGGPISNVGEVLPWIHQMPSATNIYSMGMGNINNDPYLEILYTNGPVYLVDYTGESLEGWPKFLTPFFADGEPTIMDIIGDEQKEIIIPWWSYNGEKPGLYIYNLDGTLVEGYPKFEGLIEISSVVVDDINNDGSIEVIGFSKKSHTILVLDLEKEYDPQAMEWSSFQHNNQYTGNYNFRRCSNEVAYNEYSSEQPLFCSNGDMIDNCQECGCPMNESCQEDGSCDLVKKDDAETTSSFK